MKHKFKAFKLTFSGANFVSFIIWFGTINRLYSLTTKQQQREKDEANVTHIAIDMGGMRFDSWAGQIGHLFNSDTLNKLAAAATFV